MDNQRISKLKNIVECILNYCYYNKFIPLIDISKYQDIPENEQIIGIFGKIPRKIIGKYSFKEYMENKMENYKPKKGDELVKEMIIIFRDRGYGYQLFPENMFSDEYIGKLDEEIKSLVDDILEFMKTDLYKLRHENEDNFNKCEDEYSTKISNIHMYLLTKLFLNKLIDVDDIDDYDYSDIIEPQMHELYNIKDIHDED